MKFVCINEVRYKILTVEYYVHKVISGYIYQYIVISGKDIVNVNNMGITNFCLIEFQFHLNQYF